MENKNEEYARNLKSRHVQLIALGGTIGTGLFLGSGKSIQLAGPSIVLAYFITGAICFLLMRAMGEMLVSDLKKNSFIDFISEYLGEKIGFMAGWTYWVCWITIAMADVTATGLYFKYWFPSVPQWVPGLVAVVILLLINLITVGLFGEMEFWFAIVKIVAIIALIIVGIVMVIVGFKTPTGHASLGNLVNYGGLFPKGLKGFLLSFQMVTFGFIGIEMVGVTASEAENPKVVIPKAINEIPTRVIIFYVGALLAIMSIYPWSSISPKESPFVQVFESIGITIAAGIINFVVLTAALSATNSALFTTGRMLFSLNYDGKSKFAKKMGTLSKTQVPANGLIFSAIVITVAVIANFIVPSTALFTFISSVATTCFLFIWGAIVCAHLKFKKVNQSSDTKFATPLYPLGDYLVLAFLAFVGVIMLLETTTRIALISSLVWFGILLIVQKFKQNGND